MNTQDQIAEAFADYHAGVFGPILRVIRTEQDIARNMKLKHVMDFTIVRS